MTIRQMRELLGMSAQKFGDKYGIPMRSIQNWEGGQSKCPDYVLKLLERNVWEDYEEEYGEVKEYRVEYEEAEDCYDSCIITTDDLEEAKSVARKRVAEGDKVYVCKNRDFLIGSFDTIGF